MDHDKIRELIRAALGADGKLTCEEAQQLAKKAGVEPGVVGKLANEMKIKIKGCRLGCF